MASEHEAVLEAEEQVFAHGLDFQEAAPIEAVCDAGHAGAGMRRLDCEFLADEYLEALRGAVE